MSRGDQFLSVRSWFCNNTTQQKAPSETRKAVLNTLLLIPDYCFITGRNLRPFGRTEECTRTYDSVGSAEVKVIF